MQVISTKKSIKELGVCRRNDNNINGFFCSCGGK